MTESNEQDPSHVPDLLSQIDQAIDRFVADGIYDQAVRYIGSVQETEISRFLGLGTDPMDTWLILAEKLESGNGEGSVACQEKAVGSGTLKRNPVSPRRTWLRLDCFKSSSEAANFVGGNETRVDTLHQVNMPLGFL